MKAPFVYFGGKGPIAGLVWRALGQPRHYIEPLFGSGAVLLARPKWDPTRHTETVNDADGFIANVWRALQHAPDETAKWCDWPVNHADLIARRRQLLANETRLLDNLIADPEWYDAKLAGYWIWAASCWIGSGLTRPNAIPHISGGGNGVYAIGRRPHLSNGGNGVYAIGRRPHLSNGGNGVHAIGQRPHLSDGGKGVQEPYNTNIYAWFRQLSERLRYVRIVCGDWTRVCSGDWQDDMGDVGIFFDPPYGVENRDKDIYHHESLTVAQDVAQWCLERGSKPTYRIVLAGYVEEHEWLLEHGWRMKRWKANGGYGNLGSQDSQGKTNRHREALFFSPHCLNKDNTQMTLFEAE